MFIYEVGGSTDSALRDSTVPRSTITTVAKRGCKTREMHTGCQCSRSRICSGRHLYSRCCRCNESHGSGERVSLPLSSHCMRPSHWHLDLPRVISLQTWHESCLKIIF